MEPEPKICEEGFWERKFDSFIDETGWAAYKVARAAFLFY